jgi:hypothetical protein
MDNNKKTGSTAINQPKVVLKGKSVDMTTKENKAFLPLAIGIALMVLAGIGTGYALSRSKVQGVSVSETGAKMINTEKVVGSLDQAFNNDAEGTLVKGGIDGEGTHHLERDGGADQYVYLISSVIALDEYVGKKVKVWGETNKAQQAGWLMDVGKLELLE